METTFNVGSIFGYYASFSAFLTLGQQSYNQFVPQQIREYINEKVLNWFKKPSILDPKIFTLVVRECYKNEGYNCSNGVYRACEAYLANKLKPLSTQLEGCRRDEDHGHDVYYHLSQGEEYVEYVKLDENNVNVKLHWEFSCKNDKGEKEQQINASNVHKSFLLSFDPQYKDIILGSYIPSVVMKSYDTMIEMSKDIFLYTYQGGMSSRHWHPVSFKHPFTFDALALDPELKKSIVDDLDRFIKRKEFYKKIGRAWKRGYLLYGPPGTGKSSLIAAIANYLKFSIYDLQLSGIEKDATLRNLMMSITNKSILVIEDIDCATGLSKKAPLTRENHEYNGYTSDEYDYNEYDNDDSIKVQPGGEPTSNDVAEVSNTLSLSGLLNFIDGLWSSCGDERIIILTTNYKERLDPALLRPGRMDMHIHMSYLRMPGFRILASNYLGLSGEHPLFSKIEELLNTTDVSPAEAAEELIRSEDPDIALAGVVKMLKQKKSDQSSQKQKKRKKKRNKKGRKAMKREKVDANVNNNDELTSQVVEG
ncbi:AAA-ATPase At2g18190-like [Chenopodium quinoa]|uniref:AAA-ATPase At2g18190-like n=1 Tax=Chenopodium quinoa TaxID=63459 RepID=UPI000B7968BC|nr:AAA-ATPase At2g18190-like [Chenopodium quinoa]